MKSLSAFPSPNFRSFAANSQTVRSSLRTLFLVPSVAALAIAQVSVTTYHNDNSRTGQNVQETVLNPGNVNSTQFGKLYSTSVDGYVYAQPLYIPNVQNIAGGTHNVLYVATEHDSLYAIDADSGAVLWQKSFIDADDGITTVPSGDVYCTDLVPEIGITGTPVIDPATNTLYVVVRTKENGVYLQRLHAIDMVTKAEKFGGPVAIAATVNGTGVGGNGSTVSFDPLQHNSRPGLLLENGHVVIAWASQCDNNPYHGWIMFYGASSLAQEAVFNTSPNGAEAGVWMSGDGLTADSNGNIFVATGNGTYDGPTSRDYGDSILRLTGPSGGQSTVADWFTPSNQASLSKGDTDLNSGGVLLLPDLPAGSAHTQLLVAMGKEGTIYLVDRNNMGKYCSGCASDTQIVQEIPGATAGMWGSPAYWNGSVYWGGGVDEGGSDPLRAFSFNANNSGVLSTSPTSKSVQLFSYSTAAPVISANGNSNGILWILDNSSFKSNCCQVLYAYDATNLATMLYNSSQAGHNRDQSGGAVKLTAPVVVNGKVYAGGQASVTAWGLLPTLTLSANPASVTIPAPGGSGYTKISIVPGQGLTGTVNLTCTVAFAGPGTAHYPPTCSFDASQVNIIGTANGSSTLEFYTSAPENTALRHAKRTSRYAPFPGEGAGILACACLLGACGKRRRWTSALGMFVFVVLIGFSISCGGGSETALEKAGTSVGQYTVTVSATSGATSSSTAVTLVVQ